MADAMVWQAQDISGGTVTFQPGQRYAVLASVGTSRSLSEIENYLQGKGFLVTYGCEKVDGSQFACSSRDQYNIDAWLAGITAAPRSGERWVYAEGNFQGTSPWSVDVTDGFPKTLIVTYSIANVFLAVAQAQGEQLPAEPTTPASSSSSALPWVAGGVLAATGLYLGYRWWIA